jgi:hypothetical protein
MPQKTQLGQKVAQWSTSAKAEFKSDMESLAKLPPRVLHNLVDKIAKTYPACNPTELAALEAEASSTADPQVFADAVAVFTYLWDNIDGESPADVAADFEALGLLSHESSGMVTDLLASAEPFRETARVESSYIRIGAALFVGIRGTVDLRLRFHKTDDDFMIGAPPAKLIGSQAVVMANLTINDPGNQERVIPFLMDENDINSLKRFIRHMEAELALSKELIKAPERNEP